MDFKLLSKRVKTWIISHRYIFYTLTSFGATLLTFTPLMKEGNIDWSTIDILVTSLAIIVFFFFIVLEWRSVSRVRIYDPSDKHLIQDYMEKWIAPSGRVAVWTRDMTWANNENAKKILRAKARNKELVICQQDETPLSKELKDHGAEIHFYSAAHYSPKTRFTIRNYRRAGASVAIGYQKDGLHYIEEFRSPWESAHPLTEDLVKLAVAYSKTKG